MTVCVAALCNNGTTIFGACDRMITAGNVQFEPPQTKIWTVTEEICLLVSGDVGLHADYFTDLQSEVRQRALSHPGHKWRVRDIARMYLAAQTTMQAIGAERDYLLPLGLTTATFISRQKEMSDEFAKHLANKIINFTVL